MFMKLRLIKFKINEKFKPRKIIVSIISHSGTYPLKVRIVSFEQSQFINEYIDFFLDKEISYFISF